LQKEYLKIQQEPIPNIVCRPLSNNILEWHYVIYGITEGVYQSGYYHGKVVFPPEYPFKPPSIYMETPSGRFQTGSRLCLSMSDFHPETWNPLWSVSSILTGLLSFMQEDKSTYGSVTSSDEEKKAYASRSYSFNCKNKTFAHLFPEMIEHQEKSIKVNSIKVEEVISQPIEDLNGQSSLLYTFIFIILFAVVAYVSW
jgi:ubiquitin-conjugating enzyme E2 J2